MRQASSVAHRRHALITAFGGAMVALAASARLDAQSEQVLGGRYRAAYRIEGSGPDQFLGWSSDRIPDLSGDGIPDLVVGAPAGDTAEVSGALVFALTAAGARLVSRVDDTRSHQRLGYAVAGIGDVNGDGENDVVAGALTGGRTGDGYVLWLDGTDRTQDLAASDQAAHPGVFARAPGGSDTHDFGHTLEALGLHGDVLEATRGRTGGPAGVVVDWFTPGASGGPVLRAKVQGHGFSHDPAVACVGDVTGGDGIADWLMSSSDTRDGEVFTFEHRGRVSLIDGSRQGIGAVVHVHDIRVFSFDGPEPGDDIGAQVSYGESPLAATGDLTGDGVADFAVGAAPSRSNRGAVLFFGGADGAFLFRLEKPAGLTDGFGAMVANLGDLDGDGGDDLGIGAGFPPDTAVTSVTFFNPRRREVIDTLRAAAPGDMLGRSISSLGDVNGDGSPDFGIGVPGSDTAGTNAGSLIVFLSVPEDDPFHRGDANTDGAFDISDGISLLGYLFVGTKLLSCLDAADANDDGRIDVSDAILIFQFLAAGMTPPPAPGPLPADCGPDPDAPGSARRLGCLRYTGC